MKNTLTTIALVWTMLGLSARANEAALDADRQWPQWRGPLGTGVAPHGDPPVEWAEEKNVRWKLELPGSGHSTPIVWGDLVFVTTAVPFGEPVARDPGAHDHGDHDPGAHDNVSPSRRMNFVVLAVGRSDGKVAWQRTVVSEQPHEAAHVTGSWASNSPVTDGEHLWAYFGSRGLFKLDMKGEVEWKKDFGDMRVRHEHGEGSSPALHGDTLVVNWDHQGESFVAALDKRTGEERWRAARDEITSWSTPLVVESGGRAQVVVAATKRVRSYDLATGRLIWECAGLSRNVVASPVAGGGMVFVANSYDWQAMIAVRLAGAEGDVTGTDAIVWTRDRDTPYVPSPLLYDGMLFFLKHSHGFLSAVDAATGATLFGPQRLPPGVRNVFASPVGAAGRVYVASREGATLVLERAPEFRALALNRLDDSFSASPAIVGDELYLRGQRHLYLIAPSLPAARRGPD